MPLPVFNGFLYSALVYSQPGTADEGVRKRPGSAAAAPTPVRALGGAAAWDAVIEESIQHILAQRPAALESVPGAADPRTAAGHQAAPRRLRQPRKLARGVQPLDADGWTLSDTPLEGQSGYVAALSFKRYSASSGTRREPGAAPCHRTTAVLFVLVVLGAIVAALWLRPGEAPAARQSADPTGQPLAAVAQRATLDDSADTPASPLARTLAQSGEALTAALHGTVRCGGTPIAGATVFLRLSPDGSADRAVAELPAPVRRPAVAPMAVVASGGDGRFTIQLPERSKSYRVDLGVIANSYRPGFILDIHVPRSEPVDVALQPGLTIRGTVFCDEEAVPAVTLLAHRGRPSRSVSVVSLAVAVAACGPASDAGDGQPWLEAEVGTEWISIWSNENPRRGVEVDSLDDGAVAQSRCDCCRAPVIARTPYCHDKRRRGGSSRLQRPPHRATWPYGSPRGRQPAWCGQCAGDGSPTAGRDARGAAGLRRRGRGHR